VGVVGAQAALALAHSTLLNGLTIKSSLGIVYFIYLGLFTFFFSFLSVFRLRGERGAIIGIGNRD